MKSLKDVHKKSINEVFNVIEGFMQELRNYLTEVSKAIVNFVQVWNEAQTASCACPQKSTTTLTTTRTTVKTTQSKLCNK
jgi:hypothetical protein